MLAHWMEVNWICLGAYILTKDVWPPTKYICGALIVVMSIIRIFG